jgi:DHA2 family multidrug resistance protein
MSTPVPPAGKPPLTGAPLALLTIAVAFSTFMEVLDITIVNVSVPHIAGSLGVSPNEGTWAISSYSLASAIMQPLTGWIAKRFGEVRSFCISVLLFVAMSMLCGMATTMPMLVIARLLQGAGSGPMVALSQSLLLNNYPPERRGIALAIWAMTVVVAPIFGPILGGWITDNYAWPWIFFINVPVGALAAFVTWTLLKGRESSSQKIPLDVVGLVLLVLGVGCLQFMLDNGNDKDWFSSPLILTLGIVAAVGLTFFIAWELTDDHPVVDLSLFRKRNFAVGVGALAFGMIGFFGINVIFPLWLQTDLSYTATWAGLATAPVGILAFLISPIIGRNIQKFELRTVATIAFCIFGGCAIWFATFPSDAAFGTLVWPRFLMGAGIACFFVPINQIILSGLKPNEIASAAGISNFCRTLAASFSTAVMVTLYQHRSEYHHALLVEHVNATNPAVSNYIGDLNALGAHAKGAWAVIENVVMRESLTSSVNDVFLICAVLFFAMIPVIWLAKPPFGTVGAAGSH